MLNSVLCLLFAGVAQSAVIITAEPSDVEKPLGFELTETRLESLQNSMLEILQLLHHQVIGIDSCASVPSPGLYKLACERCPKLPTVHCANGSLGGGWLVIQQRLDGSVDFNRYWDDYRNGFGTIGRGSEFWLGLEQIHQITANGDYELAVELKGESGLYGFARYSQLRLAGETERYRISALGQYSGTIGDKLSQHRDLPFSTRDRDHDQSGTSCAEYYSGGWWYKSCASCILNGSYKKLEHNNRGMSWPSWTYAATYSRMMIRRK